MPSVSAGDHFPTLPHLGDLSGLLDREAIVLFFYPAAATGG